jgi:hypothetical protein
MQTKELETQLFIQDFNYKPTTSGAKEISRFSEVPVLGGSRNRCFRFAC